MKKNSLIELNDDLVQLLFMGLLERKANTQEVDYWKNHFAGKGDAKDLISLLSNSIEARLIRHFKNKNDDPFFQFLCEFDAISVIRNHAVADQVADPEYIVNFLGARVSPKVFPKVLEERKGMIEPLPIPANWHADIAEWAAALRSIDKANKVYRIIELGCGWGCWLTNMGVAARNAGLQLDLIGIEGDKGHLLFAEDSMAANKFQDSDYRLVHGVASATKQRALFPVIKDSGGDYGAEPIFGPSDEQITKEVSSGSYEVLEGFTLGELSNQKDVDLLHIDIQGSEVDFITENFLGIDKYVKRILIGTHSREIDGQLMEFFKGNGYLLEMERPSILSLNKGIPHIRVDGVQLWANPRFS